MTQKNPPLRFKQADGTEYPDWQSVRLGDVAVPITRSVGDKDLPSHSITAGVGFVSHIEKWGKDIAGKQKPKYLHIKKGEFVYNKGNSKTYTTGCIYLLNADNDIAVPNVFIAFFTDQKKLNSHFLSQFFIGDKHKIELRKYITSSARSDGLLNISKGDFFKMKVPMPHLDEQAKIADFLSIIDKRIKLLQAKYDNLQKYKTGILQKIFTQQIRFKHPNGKNYPDWQTLRLEQVADCLDNKRVPLSTQERNQRQGEYPYYGANGIVDYIDDYIFNQPLVLLAEDGGYFEQYQTRPIANLSYGKCWVNNHTHVLCAKKNIINEFLYYSLVHKNILGYVNVGTRSKLNKGDMLKIPVPVPHLDEQAKIAEFLSALDKKITKTKTKITATKSFKQGVLQQMFV